MDECKITLKQTIEPPWLNLEPLYLGQVGAGLGTPDLYGLIECAGQPKIRLNLYDCEWSSAFTTAFIWEGWAVVGFSNFIAFVCVQDVNPVHLYKLRDYFGGVWKGKEYLLVSSASDLLCFSSGGSLVWLTQDLGLDGVVVNKVENEIIVGAGEWDPPNGWKSFALSLQTGKRVEYPTQTQAENG